MKNINIIITTFLFLAFVLFSCQKTEVSDFQDKAVVEAYLFADQTPTVKISKLIPFTGNVTFSDEDVDNLTIEITQISTGRIFSLTNIGDGKYRNEELNIKVGETYQISFNYNGEIVQATTTVPYKPSNVKLSASSVTISQPGDVGSGMPPGRTADLVIKWDNSEKEYYLVVVQNMESVPVAIYDVDEEDIPSLNFRSEPTQADSCRINSRTFQYYGRHRVIIHKIQPEYALLYSNNSNSSLSLTEIHANIINGFGIFTAINSDTLYLRVVSP